MSAVAARLISSTSTGAGAGSSSVWVAVGGVARSVCVGDGEPSDCVAIGVGVTVGSVSVATGVAVGGADGGVGLAVAAGGRCVWVGGAGVTVGAAGSQPMSRTTNIVTMIVLVYLTSAFAFWYDVSHERSQIQVSFATAEYWENGGSEHRYCTWWWYNDAWFR